MERLIGAEKLVDKYKGYKTYMQWKKKSLFGYYIWFTVLFVSDFVISIISFKERKIGTA